VKAVDANLLDLLKVGQVLWSGVSVCDPSRWSGADGEGVGGHLLGFGMEGHRVGFGEEFEAEVAALFGPFVVLLGEDGADETDDAVAVGEDPDDVGAAPDLAVQALVGVVPSSPGWL